jgi:hypothetical protein
VFLLFLTFYINTNRKFQETVDNGNGGVSKSEGALSSLAHVKNTKIEHPLQNQLHPLQYSWSFWFLKGDRTKDWVDCLRKVAEFHTVEDFWGYHEFTFITKFMIR